MKNVKGDLPKELEKELLFALLLADIFQTA
jgi:hypothetical protein